MMKPRPATAARKNKRKPNAPETAFAWRNEPGAKEYLRRVDRQQARPSAAADDGVAEQPGNGEACHPARRLPAVRYRVRGKIVGDRHSCHRAALDLALRVV